MSGHSKWSTIKRQKEATDAKKGILFSKFSRVISLAARDGANSDSNFKLRLAIERARAVNMPKDNIDRAISKASGPEFVEEVVYEGFGPGGIAVVVEVVTDNKNRTAQEMKYLFDRNGGKLGVPGSVSYQFDQVGELLVSKPGDKEEQILELIDAGVDDVEPTEDGIEVYCAPSLLSEMCDALVTLGYEIKRSELALKPKTLVTISDPDTVKKALSFLDTLEGHDDIQNVYSNVNIDEK